MSESFKQQGIPGEVSGVISENLPRPHLSRPHDSVSPSSLPALGVDGFGFEVSVPPTESFDDLPLDARSSHKGLHCPLLATESADQGLGLGSLQPNDSGRVRFSRPDLTDGIERDSLDFNQVVGEDGEGGPIPDLGTPANGVGFGFSVSLLLALRESESFQEKGDVAFRELLSAESLAFGDHLSDLFFVFRSGVPFVYQGRDISVVEALYELAQSVALVSDIEIGQRRSFKNNQLQGFPLEALLQQLDHSLDGLSGAQVGGTQAVATAPLVGEIEAGFPDRAASGSEWHLRAEDAPADAPVSRSQGYGRGVSRYVPGARLELARFNSGDFEPPTRSNRPNDLPGTPSVSPDSRNQASATEGSRRVPPTVPPVISLLPVSRNAKMLGKSAAKSSGENREDGSLMLTLSTTSSRAAASMRTRGIT